jgi:hypothetical protein
VDRQMESSRATLGQQDEFMPLEEPQK